MKEKIYTIPINDGFAQDEVCPFCFISDKLESDEIEYTLGPSMMEPDARVESNEKGFCKTHLNMMINSDKKLSLSLMLSTHLKHMEEELKKGEFKKVGRFSKKQETLKFDCVVCSKLKYHEERYIDTFFYMLKKDADFKDRIKNCKALCIYHGKMLMNEAKSEGDFAVSKELLVNSLNKNTAELLEFIDTFDYRAKNVDPLKYKDTVKNAVNITRGSIKNL